MAITTPTRKPMTTRSKASAKRPTKRPTKRDQKSHYKTKIKAQPSKAVKASKESTKQKGLKEEDVQPRLRGKEKMSDSSNIIVIDDDDNEIEDDHKMCTQQMKKPAAGTEDDLCKGEDVFYDTLGYLPKPINDATEDVSKEEDVEMRGLEPEGISFSTFSTPVAKEERSGWNLFKLFIPNSQPKQEP